MLKKTLLSKVLLISAVSFFCFIVTGCLNFGPKYLPYNRKNFNIALQNSDKEQILLNLVRLQYAEEPYFLGVSSISAQLEIIGRLEATGQVNSRPFSNFVSVRPAAEFKEKPTISYSPLQGEKFTNQILSPIKIENIYLLVQSGWSMARVLRIATQSINSIPNAPSSARPSTSHIPKYKEFNQLAHQLRELQRDDLITVSASQRKKSISIDIILRGSSSHIKQLSKLLKKPLSGNVIKLIQSDLPSNEKNVISIQARSVLGMMYYLSKSVEVRLDELKAGIVEFPRTPAGGYFNWQDVTKGMMTIHSSTSRPSCAYVAVYYRNRWFYIADNDMNSKETLSLMTLIFALQAGSASGAGPLLTLPVG